MDKWDQMGNKSEEEERGMGLTPLNRTHVLLLSMGQEGARGVTHPPKSAKRYTFYYKMDQKWGFCKGLGSKGHFLGSCTP